MDNAFNLEVMMDGETRRHARTLTLTQIHVSCSVWTICGINVFLHDNRNKILCRSVLGVKWFLYM